MVDIKVREEKIKEKRKQTPFRDFVKEICSWYAIVLHKNKGKLSKFPDTDRKDNLIPFSEFDALRDGLTDHGLEYDLNKPLFDQYGELLKNVEFPLLVNYAGSENCDFADAVLNSRTVYLSFAVISNCENVLYSLTVKNHCNNVLNSFWIIQSENIYLCSGVTGSYNIFYSKYLNDCSDVWFGIDLNGCRECIRCNGLDNKSYCIDNKEYPKDEYLKMKKEILAQKDMFFQWYQKLGVESRNFGSEGVSGINVVRSHDVEDGYSINQVRNGRNLICVGGEGVSENMYDIFGSTPECLDAYACAGVGVGANNIYCSNYITGSSSIYYSYFLENCSYCLGCIGLRNKQFCILNKEYSKEERFELVDKIFAKMGKDGVLGNSFPGRVNPFYFNDTLSSLIDDSFTKEELEKEGYLRRDEEIKVDIPEDADVVEVKDLDQYQGFEDGVWKIDPEILKKVIKDEKGNYYRIVKMEYDFLMKYGLPLPELHWLERIKLGFKFK